MNNEEPKKTNATKMPYNKPVIDSHIIDEAYAQGGGGGKTCNGGSNGGRKDTAGAGCTILLT